MSSEQLATLQACGRYDPEEPWAADRREAIGLVLERGATVEELCASEDVLGVVAARLSLRPHGAEWSRRELAERTGVPLTMIESVWRAAGFPDPGPDAKVTGRADVPVYQAFAAAAELFGTDAVLQMTRVIGAAVARVADAMVSAFVVNLGPPALDDPSGLAMVRANLDATALVPPLLGAIDQLLRQHMLLASRPVPGTGRLDAGDVGGGVEVRTMTVGFLDLADSTRLVQERPFAELAALMAEFEQQATDAVVALGGRVVKLIGDEVMFTTEEAPAACAAALRVRDAFAGHPVLRGLRGGVATGPVLVRDGDCFGPVVNLASRLVKRAGVDEIVVDAAVAEALGAGSGPDGGITAQPLGAWRIDGFDAAVAVSRVGRAGGP